MVFVVASIIAAYLASALVEYPFLKMYKKPVTKKSETSPRVFEPIELSAPTLSMAGPGGKV